MKKRNEEDELMERIAKEMLKNGDVKTVFDVESKLKQLFDKVIQSMLEAEMTEHLGDSKYEYSQENEKNYRNRFSKRKIKYL